MNFRSLPVWRSTFENSFRLQPGMGGGSSDAAAVLVGVNRMFQLRLTKRELMERSVAIGADVPFCVLRGTALAEGIGEILTPLPSLPKCFVLIAKPPINVSTKFVYTNLRANELTCHPDIDGQILALQDGDLEAVCKKWEMCWKRLPYRLIRSSRQSKIK